MKIIDIHAHIYPKVAGITNGLPMTSEPLGRVKVGNELRQFLPPSFEHTHSTAEMLIAYMDWCGIDKALLMPNPYYGYHNEYFIESAEKYPNRLRAVALVDPLKGEAAAKELAWLYDNTCLFGFKVETDSTFQCSPHSHMMSPELAPVWDCCAQYHQPVFLHLFTAQDIADLIQMVQLYPDITFIICHMGVDACFAPGAEADAYSTILGLVKEHSNVYIDTSTVPVYFQEEYPFPSSVRIIEQCYRKIGPEKMMWASDYPGMLNHATMKQLIGLTAEQCAIPENDMRLIMGENADRLFFGNE
ncbi:MAG: amidohydrolase family protein [Lachnospiraceae bacterium]|nr:amidohydrolase family protein [Lachnospiraceae bacterium]